MVARVVMTGVVVMAATPALSSVALVLRKTLSAALKTSLYVPAVNSIFAMWLRTVKGNWRAHKVRTALAQQHPLSLFGLSQMSLMSNSPSWLGKPVRTLDRAFLNVSSFLGAWSRRISTLI